MCFLARDLGKMRKHFFYLIVYFSSKDLIYKKVYNTGENHAHGLTFSFFFFGGGGNLPSFDFFHFCSFAFLSFPYNKIQ